MKFSLLKKWILTFITIVFSTVVFAGLAPDEIIRKTADDVISALKSDKNLQSGNNQKLYQLAEEKILPSFDFERISRLVLGKAWRKATDQQKEQFKVEFRRLLLRTYSVALSKYKDEGIEIKPMRMEPSDEIVTVKTEIVRDGAQPIKVNYTLAKNGDSWFVFDIIIEGVSLVTNYRSQFSSLIRKGGLDSLNKKLAKKNKSYKD
jgi:phospholipid transport system substrate-binding protein